MMIANEISLVEENYLKALFNLGGNKGEVSVNELSKQLQIKMPTVNSMMKKMAEKKLVYYESYKPLRLTEKGRKEAALIVRKHRLTEMFLVEKMGFGWEQVHPIAEQVEHVRSAEFFEKMDELLGHPTVDPHGSPIPDRNGKMEWISYTQLSNTQPGESVVLSAVTDSSESFLEFLNSRKFNLGTIFKIKHIEPFDGSMSVLILPSRKAEMLSRIVAEKLLVVPHT